MHRPPAGRPGTAAVYEAMQLTPDPGQTLITFTAEPGSPSQ
jgi:hypothetical protein